MERAVILDFEGGKKTILSMPVYVVHPNGKGVLCIGNERHHRCRLSYSYDGGYNESSNVNVVKDDGIFWRDFDYDNVPNITHIENMNIIKPISPMSDGPVHLE